MVARPELRELSRAWAQRDRLDIVDWCEKHIVLPAAYARPGPFRVGGSRHLIDPLRAFQDPDVLEMSTCKAIQTGGSLLTELCIAWMLANAPGPTMWTMQSDDDASEHCKGRFNSLLNACAPVRATFPIGSRHNKTTTEIWFGDYFLLVNGANKNNLQAKSIRYKFNSECWLWLQGLMKQAKGRVSAFEETGTSKVVNESQGCMVGQDFELEWKSGTQEEWSVACESCGRHNRLDFFGRIKTDSTKRACVVWDPQAVGERGLFDEQRVRDTVRWVCPDCGHDHADTARTRAKWNDGGKYVAANTTVKKRRSFRWGALIGHSMGDLAVEWLNASIFKSRGIIAPMRDFYLQRIPEFFKSEEAETFNLKTEITLSDYKLADLAKDPQRRFPGEELRLAGIDRQLDHFWMVIRAFAADGESWLVWRGKVLTIEACIELSDKYGALRDHTFEDAQHNTSEVYDDCVTYGIVAVHGSGKDEFVWDVDDGRGGTERVYKFYSRVKRTRVPGGEARYIHWASDPIKDTLAKFKTGRGAARWNVPADVDEGMEKNLAYTRQLSGDRKKERLNKDTGRMELRWTKVWDNHLWDCEAIILAMAMALGLLPAPVRADSKQPAPAEPAAG